LLQSTTVLLQKPAVPKSPTLIAQNTGFFHKAVHGSLLKRTQHYSLQHYCLREVCVVWSLVLTILLFGINLLIFRVASLSRQEEEICPPHAVKRSKPKKKVIGAETRTVDEDAA